MKTRAILLAAMTLAADTAAAQPAPEIPAHAVVRHVSPSEVAPGSDLLLVAIIDDAWVEDGLVARYRVAGRGGTLAQRAVRALHRRRHLRHHPGQRDRPAGCRVLHRRTAQRSGPLRQRRNAARGAGRAAALAAMDGGGAPPARRSALRGGRALRGAGFRRQQRRGPLPARRGGLDLPAGRRALLNHARVRHARGRDAVVGNDTAVQLDRAVRWGQGGFRMRLARALWLDAHAMLGLGESGFLAGGGGQLILGDDWRTCVVLGGEWLEELSYRGWLTLQWDTVPPFLMSATVATTDQPDARIDTGSTVRYLIELPVGDHFRIGAHTSFGARGNRPGWFGGGLQTQVNF